MQTARFSTPEVIRYEAPSVFVQESRQGDLLWSVSELILEPRGDQTVVTVHQRVHARYGNLVHLSALREQMVMLKDWHFACLKELIAGGWPAVVASSQTPLPVTLTPGR